MRKNRKLGTTYVVVIETDDPELYRLLVWLQAEWDYAKAKYGHIATRQWDDQLADLEYTEWWQVITNYLGRSDVFGFDSFRGRQQLAKTAQTLLALVTSVMRLHGDLPDPGRSSTETVTYQGTPVQ